ncbi:hypothetical protein D822_09785 [Streptococcus ratti FA-1 = DSM 20564]|uniref:Transcriptional regulator n=2 Tax=Streptococcus ratti TaxID=1341 RepID=A0A7X9LEH8_STRRT|nr:hypothetical protein SRA_01327 [Streptococcus ratti FA-1 = DSM 20564]EMP67116.1 hypothetical protein D822_09785 [Streptococcus ratti FA-1 = DSM 20564]NMD49791.1 transcriptional regulator [Streptococcus ratti]QEY06932.1 transcriptional regulator [Streptococcus ratti]
MRVEALKRIQNDLAECMANLQFEIYIVNAEEKVVLDSNFSG